MSTDNGAPTATDATATALPGTDPGQVVDKAALLAGHAFGVRSVPIPGMGVIKVRPLSRAEAMSLYGRELDAAEMEQQVLALACVAPTFTPGEVKIWQASSAAGDMLVVVNAVLEMSGMDIGAGKVAYKTFRGAS
jgi:hypothetical protein